MPYKGDRSPLNTSPPSACLTRLTLPTPRRPDSRTKANCRECWLFILTEPGPFYIFQLSVFTLVKNEVLHRFYGYYW